MSGAPAQPVPAEGVPLDDRGLAYGDGLFETVLVRDGVPLLWEQHLARLARGGVALGIALPARATLDALPARAGKGLRVLKLVLTRGSGGRGYQPPEAPTPRLRWQAAPFSPSPSRWQGVRVRHCALSLAIQPRLAGLKHLNRLENVLARAEWTDPGIAEGLLSDAEGRVVEATCMNLFWWREGRWETPRLERCGVAGTLREALLARLAIREVDARPEVLASSEAVCLANSVQGVWPLTRLEDAEGRPLARWSPGVRHRALQAEAHGLLGYPRHPGASTE
ncbi:aminodeoxychorismate lyase [Halomonas maura]|uniref:aminodeoxychorismate lyase n=1 Tax=Halomonas maura TaxID=117606 RepID=UPI0025B4AE82|nr:aminodeoxychorismate lyase [Halomonas maura]MDN3555674.1 aminodeoxychorismate lyase [Halomonas maura]